MLSRTLPSLLRTRCCPLLARAAVMRASPAALVARPPALLLRHCTTPPGQAAAGKAAAPDEEAPKAEAEAAKPAEPTAAEGAGLMNTGADSGPGKGLALDDDDENLPPLAFEPGVAGAAQKGVSAVVIVFGAIAFGACAWGISTALFPSATSTDVIFSEALEKVSQDPNVAFALGTPMRGFGSGGGRGEGRRNAKERWEVSEGGNEYSVVRFQVAGSQGSALVQAQVPKQRRRGEFRYIIVELPRRRLVHARLATSEDAPAQPRPPVALSRRPRSRRRSALTFASLARSLLLRRSWTIEPRRPPSSPPPPPRQRRRPRLRRWLPWHRVQAAPRRLRSEPDAAASATVYAAACSISIARFACRC